MQRVPSVVGTTAVSATHAFLADAHFDLVGAGFHEVGGWAIDRLFGIRNECQGACAFDETVEVVVCRVCPRFGIGAAHEFAVMQFIAFRREGNFISHEGGRQCRDPRQPIGGGFLLKNDCSGMMRSIAWVGLSMT